MLWEGGGNRKRESRLAGFFLKWFVSNSRYKIRTTFSLQQYVMSLLFKNFTVQVQMRIVCKSFYVDNMPTLYCISRCVLGVLVVLCVCLSIYVGP